MFVADPMVVYLHIFQERLSCIGNGLHEGALQSTNKDFQSICSNSQTCCNVVESNLSDSGLWGHLCGGSQGLRDFIIYSVCPWEFSLSLATLHLQHRHRRCSSYQILNISNDCIKWALLFNCVGKNFRIIGLERCHYLFCVSMGIFAFIGYSSSPAQAQKM
jgi:hypothetical protein